MSGGCRGRGEQEVASFSACFFCPVVCSPGIWWGIFPGNILYVKAPTFLHLGSVGAFSLPFWEYLNRISRWCQAIWPVVCPLPGHGRKCSAGNLFFCQPAGKSGFQAVRTGRILGGQRKDLVLCRPYPNAARPGTVPSRLPGACSASALRAGHWRTRLRYRRHWPPGPWRSGRIWNCPWPGRRGASIR